MIQEKGSFFGRRVPIGGVPDEIRKVVPDRILLQAPPTKNGSLTRKPRRGPWHPVGVGTDTLTGGQTRTKRPKDF